LQDNFLFDGTIAENIAFARPHASRAEIEAVARVAHCDDFVKEFEAGYDTVVGERGVKLSGGQRQRVGICRALIQNPELLLVDEPTASLDPKTSRQIMRLIKELCSERKLSAIINIHDVMLAQMFAERIVGLRQGEIVYDGPPDKLTPAVLTSIYGEEDWSATIRKVDEEAPDDEAGNVVPFDTPRLDRDRMAGLT